VVLGPAGCMVPTSGLLKDPAMPPAAAEVDTDATDPAVGSGNGLGGECRWVPGWMRRAASKLGGFVVGEVLKLGL